MKALTEYAFDFAKARSILYSRDMQHRRTISIFIVLSLLAAALSCRKVDSQVSHLGIFGGQPVPTGEHSEVAAIAYKTPAGLWQIACSGTLIHPRLVLTAGHCLDGFVKDSGPALLADKTYDDIGVYFGDGADGGFAPSALKVVRAQAHPLLRAHPRGNADAAFLELSEEVSHGPMAAPLVDLSEWIGATQTQARWTLVGFGRRENDQVGTKYQVEASLTAANSHEGAVGGEGRDSCSGDSGGPALIAGPLRLAGIISRGAGVSCGRGGIVTMVSDIICWVQQASGLPLVPQNASVDCNGTSVTYSAEEIRQLSFMSLCDGKIPANRMQRHTISALRLMLAGGSSSSCEAAAAGLRRTSSLDLSNRMLRDISPLADQRQLTALNLAGNNIAAVEGLRPLVNLKTLDLAYNRISDFSPLATLEASGLKVLGKRLQMGNFRNTEFLRLCQSPDTSEAQRRTISAIRFNMMAHTCEGTNTALVRQTSLRLGGRNLVDLTPLLDLQNLEDLNVAQNPLSDLGPLAGLERLRRLDVSGTQVADLSPLQSLMERGLVVVGWGSHGTLSER